MGKRKPVPELHKDKKTDHRGQVGVTGPGLEADGGITSAGIYDTLRQNGSELGDNVLMLVGNYLEKPRRR